MDSTGQELLTELTAETPGLWRAQDAGAHGCVRRAHLGTFRAKDPDFPTGRSLPTSPKLTRAVLMDPLR